eukprot:CAMPEP_0172319848 /NCGR_PEP_ID=MMETSP1058-20130122/38860_1 /TAXON_ID=83371 /ORGANISM="Detonula confervacea, Strain CCMP 353" /LENGTH=152 /DNA_ID=CAMNT_0013034981 /DNA_START=208 /DNA_END=666 /DNA_ORIENTATION=-
MNSTSQQQAQQPAPAFQYARRSDIRRAIQHIIRRTTLQRLAQRRLDGHRSASTRLSQTDRRHIIQQSYLLEDILYKRADTIAEYQDLSKLEERVNNAARAIFINAQRRDIVQESERRIAAAAARVRVRRPAQRRGIIMTSSREGQPERRLSV